MGTRKRIPVKKAPAKKEVVAFKQTLKAGEKKRQHKPVTVNTKNDVAETTHPAEVKVDKKSGNTVSDHGMGHSTIASKKKRDTTVHVQ